MMLFFLKLICLYIELKATEVKPIFFKADLYDFSQENIYSEVRRLPINFVVGGVGTRTDGN